MLQGLPVAPGIAVGRAVIVRFGGTPAFPRALPADALEAEEPPLRRAARAALPRGSILVADELSPADAARLDPRRVRAIALERGGPTSHASIIARSFGLPAVAGVAGLCEAVSPERPIIVDGDRGIVEPS